MKAQSRIFTIPHFNPATPRAFNALEIHTVAESYPGEDETLYFCESLVDGDDTPDDCRVFWSLYGHTPGEGLECLGDFDSFETACGLATRLGGL